MRKHAYRAWDKKAKTLYPVININLQQGNVIVDTGTGSMFLHGDRVELDEAIGLLDINKKQIFENDIIRNSRRHRIRVTWEQDDFAFRLRYPGNEGTDYFDNHDDIEVVGNLHENPEMLP